jgi:quinol monooxygenase YgiN
MNARVYFHLSLKINDGKIDAFRKIADEMSVMTSKESGALGYEWYLNADNSQCRLVETYANEAAVLAHIDGKAVRDLLPQLLQVSSITSFEVYGSPGAQAADRLRSAGAVVYRQIGGIVRP